MNDNPRLRRALTDLADQPPDSADRMAGISRRFARARHRRLVGTSALGVVLLGSALALAGAPVPGASEVASLITDNDKRPATPTPKPTPTGRPSDKPSATARPTPKPDGSEQLAVKIAVSPNGAEVGETVRIVVYARDGHGLLSSVVVRFGDGQGDHRQFRYKCAPGGGHVDERIPFGHAYSKPGDYLIGATVTTGGCGAAEETRAVRARVRVYARGTRPSNGPEQPRAFVRQVLPPEGMDGGPADWVHVQVAGADPDGYVSRLVVDWGDGTTTAFDYSLRECKPANSGWPATRRVEDARHVYENDGSYQVRVLVTSVGCDGRTAQHARAATTVKDPPPSPSPRPSPRPSPTKSPLPRSRG